MEELPNAVQHHEPRLPSYFEAVGGTSRQQHVTTIHHQAAGSSSFVQQQQQQQQQQHQQQKEKEKTSTQLQLPKQNEKRSVPHQLKPIVIPQTTTMVMKEFLFPFARAYPPCMAQYGIDEEHFLRIVDGLNESFMMSPMFRILGVAGMMTSYMPSLIAMGVGTGVSLASGFAGAAVSYARTRAYVTKMNKEVFTPRGLRLRILSTSAMMKLVAQDDTKAKQTLQLAPLPEYDEEDGAWDPNSALTDPRLRRMQALQGDVETLKWDVAAVKSNGGGGGIMSKMGSWQARKSEAKADKKHRKQIRRAIRHSRKAAQWDLNASQNDTQSSLRHYDEIHRQFACPDDSSDSSDSSDSDSDSDSDCGKRTKKERKSVHVHDKIAQAHSRCQRRSLNKPKKAKKYEEKRDKRIAKLHRKANKIGSKAQRKADKGKSKMERKEHKVTQRIRWIVIFPQDLAAENKLPPTPTDEEIDLGLEVQDDDDEEVRLQQYQKKKPFSFSDTKRW